MSLIDLALDAATQPASDAAYAEATKRARWAASPADWLSLALDHHDAIRRAFGACRTAAASPERSAAAKRLALVLKGHAQAEEVVLYPALAQAGARLAAGRAYAEQTALKLQLAELERLDPSGDPWWNKLEQIRRTVLQHMYEEERGWFLDLKDKAEDQTFLARRFQEEFERYAGPVEPPRVAAEPRSFDPARATTGQLDRH